MSHINYTERLLDLKDIIVTNIEATETEYQISLELKRSFHTCPCCGTQTDRVHDYRWQPVKEVSILGKKTVLLLRKRRYVCPACNKRFAERNEFLPKYQRMSSRLRQYIISRFAQMRSATSIAQECGYSLTTVLRLFRSVSYPRPNLPNVISIDEFKGNAGGHKYQCVLTNPKKKKVLDILPSRRQEELFAYFSQFDKGQRNNVNYVVMDMSEAFRSTMKTLFPRAKIVADKFHVCRLVTWAMERTRIEAQKAFGAQRRRYFKKSRWILLKRKSKLTEEETEQLQVMLSLSPTIAKAWYLKELFYELMESPDRVTAQRKLKEWNLMAGVMDLSEFRSVVHTLCNWSNEILEAFETGLSNGYTEGINNRTKVLKRTCYGIRNFERLRNRLLYLAQNSES